MRLIIIPEDTMISIDGCVVRECDMSWVPEFTGNYTGVSQKVHALQWFDDHGEIELRSHDLAIPITELGIFEQAVTIHAERKAILEAEKEEAEKALASQEAERHELLYGVTDIDIDQLLAELEAGVTDIDTDQLLAELEAEDDNENVGIAST